MIILVIKFSRLSTGCAIVTMDVEGSKKALELHEKMYLRGVSL